MARKQLEPGGRARAEILDVSDQQVEAWRQLALDGDHGSRDLLLKWAHAKALNQFCRVLEGRPRIHEAEDLAHDFTVLFEQFWPKPRHIASYTGAVLRNKALQLQKPSRTVPFENEALLVDETTLGDEPFGLPAYTDDELRVLHAFREELRTADALTRAVFERRMEDPPVPYHDIGSELGVKAGTARQRFNRLRHAVLRRFAMKR